MKHPGHVLQTKYLEPLGLSQSELARRIGVSFRRVNEICRGRRPITIDTAFRLGRFFGTGAAFWMNLQTDWDAWRAVEGGLAKECARTITPLDHLDTPDRTK